MPLTVSSDLAVPRDVVLADYSNRIDFLESLPEAFSSARAFLAASMSSSTLAKEPSPAMFRQYPIRNCCGRIDGADSNLQAKEGTGTAPTSARSLVAGSRTS
jgi:hypothetical protein